MASCETPTSQKASNQNSRPNIGGKTDIAQAHCKLIQEGDKIAMMCIYYDKMVPPNVHYQIKHNIEENESKNKKSRIDEEHDFYPPGEEGGEVLIEVEQQGDQDNLGNSFSSNLRVAT